MKKLLLAACLFSCAFCFSLYANPSLFFEKSEHDFGTVKQETEVTASVNFKNNGSSDLIISKVETSCGCTGTKVNKDKIAPGEEGTLEVTFNTGTYKGRVIKKIYLHTNVPDNEIIVFKIKANVKQ